MIAQLDWIELLTPACAPEDLAAIDDSLGHFPDWSVGRAADIRTLLLQHRATLLAQSSGGAPIPADVRFKESYVPFKMDIAGRPAQCHAWAISDLHMEMVGGCGGTPAQARARALVGLMLEINASTRTRTAT